MKSVELDIQQFVQKLDPKKVRYAVNYALNGLAYQARLKYQSGLKSDFTIRNPGLIRVGTRYSKATPSHPVATVGSVANKRRFSGWIEQEAGERLPGVKQKRHFKTGTGRKTWKSRVAGKYRAKPARKFYQVRNGKMALSAYVRYVRKHKLNHTLFLVKNVPGIYDGLYEDSDRQFVRIAYTHDSMPKRKQTLQKAVMRLLASKTAEKTVKNALSKYS